MTKHRGEIINRPCELCNRDAFLYCDSDSAFLCRTCDAAVHRANFLVARHLRQPICYKCKSLSGIFFSGAAISCDSPLCRPCAEQNLTASGLSSAEGEEEDYCVSSTESSSAVTGGVIKAKTERMNSKRVAVSSSSSVVSDDDNTDVKPSAKRRRTGTASDSPAEGVFVIWSRRLGLNGNSVVKSACEALAVCLQRLNINTTVVLPFRVSLAASFWVGLKMCGRDVATWQNLKKLETISGVPAKLIVAVERRLARVMKLRKTAKVDLEEGCAECDDA